MHTVLQLFLQQHIAIKYSQEAVKFGSFHSDVNLCNHFSLGVCVNHHLVCRRPIGNDIEGISIMFAVSFLCSLHFSLTNNPSISFSLQVKLSRELLLISKSDYWLHHTSNGSPNSCKI